MINYFYLNSCEDMPAAIAPETVLTATGKAVTEQYLLCKCLKC